MQYDDLNNLQFQPIYNYQYERMFTEIIPNGSTVRGEQRMHMVALDDERISLCAEGLRLIYDGVKRTDGEDSEYDNIDRIVTSFFLFTIQTTADCHVASKYFLLANTDYDRRYMRGKLKVILNEGFKRLYGFKPKDKLKSEWGKLGTVMTHFPKVIQDQYEKLTSILEAQANSSSWWKQERDLETHLEAVRLYESRQKDIVESVVMIDTLKLLNALDAVNDFWRNVHSCLYNFLLINTTRGELQINNYE